MSHSRMACRYPRSPYDAVHGLVYFARMIDKIRLNAAGELPEIYQKHLGRDFDGRCLKFLGVAYEPLCARALAGGTDEELLEWCFTQGRHPAPDEIEMWSDFMRKRGWRDASHDRIAFRLQEAGVTEWPPEAVTMFDFIDFDEERTPPDFSAWEPPRRA